jgi:hypothetical protein
MRFLIATACLVLIALVLWDAFEAMLLTRRVTRQFRFSRMFYDYSWRPWPVSSAPVRGETPYSVFTGRSRSSVCSACGQSG